jgi:hypothetical protein
VRPRVGDSEQEAKKGIGKEQQCEKELQNMADFEGTGGNSNAVDSKLERSTVGGSNDTVEELAARSREGDLRAELSRRRAERLTKVSYMDSFMRKALFLDYKSFNFFVHVGLDWQYYLI